MPLLTLASGAVIHHEWIAAAGTTRPLLVFLHEGLGCAAMWGDFPRRLCAETGCPGLLYDRVGYGGSSSFRASRTVDYLHDYAREELPAVLARLAPAQDYIVVGHSDGGSIGLIHAATQPPNLRGLITEAAHVFVEPVTLAGIRAAVDAYQAGRLRGLSRYHGGHTDEVFRAWHEIWLDDAFRDWNIEALLPDVRVPLLAIQGADDQYGTPAQVEAIVAAVHCARPALLADCGHVPHREQRDQALLLIRDFVLEIAGDAAGIDVLPA